MFKKKGFTPGQQLDYVVSEIRRNKFSKDWVVAHPAKHPPTEKHRDEDCLTIRELEDENKDLGYRIDMLADFLEARGATKVDRGACSLAIETIRKLDEEIGELRGR